MAGGIDWNAIGSGAAGILIAAGCLFPVVRNTLNAEGVKREEGLRSRITILEENGTKRESEFKEISAELTKMKTENDLLKRFASFEEIPATLKLYMDRHHADQMGVLNAMKIMMEGFGALMNRIAEGLKS